MSDLVYTAMPLSMSYRIQTFYIATEFFSADVKVNLWDDTDDYSFYYHETGELQEDTNGAILKKLELRSKLNKVTLSNIVIKAAALTDNILYSNIILPDAIKLPKTFWVSATGFDGYYADDDSNNWVECPVVRLGLDDIDVTAEISSQNTQTSLSEFLAYHSSITNQTRVRIPKYTETLVSPDYYNDSNFSKIIGVWWCADWRPLSESRDSYIKNQTDDLAPLSFGEGVDFYIDPSVKYFPMAIVPSSAQIHIEFDPWGNNLVLVSGIEQSKINLTKLSALRPISSSYYSRLYSNDDVFALSAPASGVDAQIIDSIESVDISTTALLSWLAPGFNNPADNPFFYITEENKSSCSLYHYYSGSENPTGELVTSSIQLDYTQSDFGTLEYSSRLSCGPQDRIGDYALLNIPFIGEIHFESESDIFIGKYAFSGSNISSVYTDHSYTYNAYEYAEIELQEGCFNELKVDQKTFPAPTLYELSLDCDVVCDPTALPKPCVVNGRCSLPYDLIDEFGVNCAYVVAYTTDGYDPSNVLQVNQLGSKLKDLQLYDLPCPSLGQNSTNYQNLETVGIVASQIYLPDNALSNIDTLCAVYLNLDPSSTEGSSYFVSIGSDAFLSCDSLHTVYLDLFSSDYSTDFMNITVGADAFKSCPSLQTVYWPDLTSWCKTTFINELSNPIYATRHQTNNSFDIEIKFSSQYELTDYNSVYHNSNQYPYSFYNNNEIGTLVLSENITKIPAYTFYKSNLKKLYIKSGSISIGEYALQDCYGLKQIIFDGTDTVTFSSSYIVNNCYQLSDIIYTAEKLSDESKYALISSFGDKIVHDQYTQNNLLYITEEETQNTFECTMSDNSIILLDIVQKPGSKTLTIPTTLSYNNAVWPCELTTSSFIDIGSSGSVLGLKTLIIDHALYDLCFDNWTTQSGAQVILKANTKNNCIQFQELFNKPAATFYIETGCEVPVTNAFTNCYLDQDKVVYQQYSDDKMGLLYTVLKAVNPQLSEYSICDTINDIPVTKISSDAFVDLTSLTKLVFPRYLTTLEENSCVSLAALTELYINSNITTLPVASGAQTWLNLGSGSKLTVFFGKFVEAIPKNLFAKTRNRIQAVQFTDSLKEIGQSAFWQMYSLTDLSIPKNIKSIGDHAFNDSVASGASSVTLDFENQELYIGTYAFCGMTIDRLSIPELTAETYSKWARYTELYDTTIKTISLPCNLAKLINIKAKNGEKLSTEIVELEFISGERINTTFNLDWSKLQKLCFPASLKTIIQFGTTHNNGLNIYFKGTLEDWTQISFPNTGYYGPKNYNLYIDDTLITDLTLPDTVREIKQYAFYNCTSLKNLDLNQVEVLGYGAFFNCKHLTTITNSDKIQKIDTYAFYSTALTSFKIPESVIPEDLGSGIFGSCKLHSLAVPSSAIKDSLSMLINGNSTVPDTLDTLIITGIDTAWNTNFLSGCAALKNLIWETQVPESFMKGAFADCHLEKVVIPEDQFNKWCSIEFEDSSANPMTSASDNFKFFVGNNELTDLEWPFDSLNPYAFCSYRFNSITLPSTLKVDNANTFNKTFFGCVSLYCTMPSVSYTLTNFIEWSTQLQGLHLTGGTIASNTLAGLTNSNLILQVDSNVSLTDDSFPSNFRAREIILETREDDFILVDNIIYNNTKLLYANKSDLTTVASVKDTTTEIKNEAFKDCQYVQIALPYTVQSIGARAFVNCVNLQVLEIPGISTIADAQGLLENCNNLRELTISDFGNTKTFGELFNCANSNVPSQLTKLLINASIIPDSYFNNCQKLRDIHLSFNVTDVGTTIFKNCCFDKATNPEASIKIEFAKPTGESLAPISSWNDNWAGEMVTEPGTEDNIITWGVTISYLIDNLYYTFDTSNQTAVLTGLSTLFKTALKTSKTVELPETIQHTNKGLGDFTVAGIGDGVFASCSNLEQITLPAGLKLIGVQAFASCRNLKDIIFNTTHTDPIAFNKNAFIGCANLTRVKLAQLASNIAAKAWATYQFENLKANPLAAPTLGCSLLVGSNTNISELDLPDTVVNQYAFAGCNNITKVKVKGCSLGAFQNCLNIDTIEIGDGGIGEAAFKTPVTSNPRSISLTVTDNAVEISDFSTLFEGRKIGSFAGPTQILKAISDKSTLTSVQLTGGTESIDATIFSTFTNGELLVVEAEKLAMLELAADIPSSLITDAFSQCSKVQTIKAPISLLNNLNLTSCEDFTENSGTTIEKIPANSFENCDKLKLFTCSDIKVIGNNAFNGVATDFNIHFEADSISLCEVGDNAFSTKGQVLKVNGANTNYLAFGLSGEIITGVVGNEKLSGKVELPHTRIVYDNAFADQTSITGFEGLNVACIGMRAFKNCSSLEELKIPNIGIIKSEAFLACTKLNTVELGDQFSYAADDSFKNALITHTINLENTDEGVTLIGLGSAKDDDTILKVLLSVEPTATKNKYDLNCIPDTVKTIAIGALDKLENKISSITLSSSAIAQKLLAKQYNLTSVRIATSVKSIGADAFEDCYALETVEYGGSRIAWCGIIFENKLANPLYYTPNYKKQFKPTPEGRNLNGEELDFSGIINIPDCTFYKCFNYTIENTEDLQEIGEYAFFESISTQTDSVGLTAVDLTKSTKLQRIKKFAFAGCTALVTLKLPAVQTLVLEDFAFANVTALEQLVANIPNISLGNYALGVSTVRNATINTQLFNILLFNRVQNLTLIEDGNPIKLENIRYLTNLQQLIFKKADQVLTEEFLSPFIGYYLAGCPALTSVSAEQDTILTKYFIKNNNVIDVDNQTLLFIARANDNKPLAIYDEILPNGTYITTIGSFAIGHLFDIPGPTGEPNRDNDTQLIIPTTITYIDKNAYTKVL